MASLTCLAATEMAQMVRDKKISPVELVEAHLKWIEKVNPLLNAIVSLSPDHVRREARAAEAALMQGRGVGPLHGVPMTIKSSIDVAGLCCEAGTPLRAGHVPTTDAALVARLRAAGAIVLGVTNSPEMLMAYETHSPLYGRTNNPWDLTRTSGGSSGGEAAAIASGCSAAGVGSDGGGSIRVPAHFCGICGLKPTPGRIPASGHYPRSVGPFALLGVVGPMARVVSDLQLLLEVMAGPDPGDPSSVPVPLRRLSEPQVRAIRIGYFAADGRTPVTPETRTAVDWAATALEHTGFHVAPFQPACLERARQLWGTFFGTCGAWLLQPLMAGRESDLPILKEHLDSTRIDPPLTAPALLQAWVEWDQLRAQLRAQMEDFPVWLCPVCSIPAFRHGERSWTIGGETVRYLDAMVYSQWANLLGFPAAVVPAGRSPEGLPIGVQVIGRPYEEEVVLGVARAIEEQCGGWQEPPLCQRITPP